MGQIYTSAQQLIGHTPLLELTNIEKAEGLQARILAKLEAGDFLCQLLRLGDGPGHALGPGGEHQLRAVGRHELAALHAHGVKKEGRYNFPSRSGRPGRRDPAETRHIPYHKLLNIHLSEACEE